MSDRSKKRVLSPEDRAQARERKRLWEREWRKNNPDKARERKKRHREKHRDQLREQQQSRWAALSDAEKAAAVARVREWRHRNSEKAAAASTRSYVKNKGQICERERNRKRTQEWRAQKKAYHRIWSIANRQHLRLYGLRWRLGRMMGVEPAMVPDDFVRVKVAILKVRRAIKETVDVRTIV